MIVQAINAGGITDVDFDIYVSLRSPSVKFERNTVTDTRIDSRRRRRRFQRLHRSIWCTYEWLGPTVRR